MAVNNLLSQNCLQSSTYVKANLRRPGGSVMNIEVLGRVCSYKTVCGEVKAQGG